VPIESKTFRTLPINCSLLGDNIVIPADSTAGFKVWKLWLVATVALTITYKNGQTVLTGPIGLVAGGSQSLPYDGTANFAIDIGNAFIINISGSGGIQVSGTVYYSRG
jgi:hypothetical protein